MMEQELKIQVRTCRVEENIWQKKKSSCNVYLKIKIYILEGLVVGAISYLALLRTNMTEASPIYTHIPDNEAILWLSNARQRWGQI